MSGYYCLSILTTYVYTKSICRHFFRIQRFKCLDFHVTDKNKPGQAKKFEVAELQDLLQEDSCQTHLEGAEQLVVFSVGRLLESNGESEEF